MTVSLVAVTGRTAAAVTQTRGCPRAPGRAVALDGAVTVPEPPRTFSSHMQRGTGKLIARVSRAASLLNFSSNSQRLCHLDLPK